MGEPSQQNTGSVAVPPSGVITAGLSVVPGHLSRLTAGDRRPSSALREALLLSPGCQGQAPVLKNWPTHKEIRPAVHPPPWLQSMALTAQPHGYGV